MYIEELVLATVFAPLVSLLVNLAGYRAIPRRWSGWIATGSVGLSAVLGWCLFLQLPFAEPLHWDLYGWIDSAYLTVSIGFFVDRLTVLMILVVTTVSACVHVYSLEYMEDDKGFRRFFLLLNLFVFAMLVLISANNLLMMFIGWEGVGLCSYLLIGFWYDRSAARWAGQKAFIVNRIGDFSFLIGIFLILTEFQTLVFTQMEAAAGNVGEHVLIGAALLLFGGAVGKSAQFPLYVWLPDAMEGPTPVSSLIHAATMVTAGVYMIARLHFLYAPHGHVLWVGEGVALVGAFTVFFAATMALVHPDMKRILAYSTVSQLGYMFVGVGLGAFGAGIYHLITHAFFKGLLFLMAGSVMHGLHGELNIFKMGGLWRSMPATAFFAVVGGLGLSGFPLLSGFWSKDEILLAALGEGSTFHWVLFGLLLCGAFLTAFYTFRMIFVAFGGPESTDGHECGLRMSVPMGVLAAGTVLGGLFGSWTARLSSGFHHGASHTFVTSSSVVVVLGGIGLAYLIYRTPFLDPAVLRRRSGGLFELLRHQYYVDELYQSVVVAPLRSTASFLWRIVDEVLIDSLVDLVAASVDITGLVLRFAQTGYTRHYLLVLGVSILSLLSIVGGLLFVFP